MKFIPTHVSILLGLPNKGTQLKLHTKDELKASYGNQYFAGLRQFQLSNVTHAFKLAANGTSEENVYDTVRLLRLYLCTTLLFANTGNNIDWFMHNWMGDIEKILTYNWSQAVYEWLVDDLLKKELRPSSVIGCTILLLVRNLST